MARKLFPLLEPYNLMFIEEPVLPEFTEHFDLIVRSTSTPIATGERLFSRGDFKDVLRSGIAVAQPDLSHAGGISECRRIAASLVLVLKWMKKQFAKLQLKAIVDVHQNGVIKMAHLPNGKNE